MSSGGKWGERRARWFEKVETFDVAKLAKELSQGANIDWRDPKGNGSSALAFYARSDFQWGVRWLLSHGARVDLVDLDGRDALGDASQAGAHGAAVELLRAGADPRRVDDWGADSLSRAKGRRGMGVDCEGKARMVSLLAPLCGKRSARRALELCVEEGDLDKAQSILACMELTPSWILSAGRPRQGPWEESVASWLRSQGLAKAESRLIREASCSGFVGSPMGQTAVASRTVRL